MGRDDFLAVGGFDELYSGWGGEDDDLIMRLKRAGVAWGKLDGAMPIHPHHRHYATICQEIGRQEEAMSPARNRERYLGRLNGGGG